MIRKMWYGWNSTAVSAARMWKVRAHNREITGSAASQGESLRSGFLVFIIVILSYLCYSDVQRRGPGADCARCSRAEQSSEMRERGLGSADIGMAARVGLHPGCLVLAACCPQSTRALVFPSEEPRQHPHLQMISLTLVSTLPAAERRGAPRLTHPPGVAVQPPWALLWRARHWWGTGGSGRDQLSSP